MNFRATSSTLGGLLVLLSIALLVPVPFSFYFKDGAHDSFLMVALIAFMVGMVFYKFVRPKKMELSTRDAFGVVTLTWIVFSIFGSLPYMQTNSIPSFVDAFFESMSGFTTTGSTILTSIEDKAPSILLWRSITQWLGGMGIIVLSLAILPFLGVGGMQLFFAETPGPSKDRLTPRVQDTAKLLWGVYCFFTVLQTILLMFAGLGFFEALNLSLTTTATGGFSIYDASVGHYTSSLVHWIVIFFMFFSGVNFTLHYRALRGKVFCYFKSEEFLLYLGIFVLAFLFVVTAIHGPGQDMAISIRDAAFQVVSIGTSTGFATKDYELWPYVTQAVLMALMIFGGCAGSTSGGMKMVRMLLFLKYSLNQLFQLLHPKAIKPIKMDHLPVSKEAIQNILGFSGLYTAVFIIASVLVCATGIDIGTAATAVISTLSNIGPGLGSIGPTENYAHFPAATKMLLSLCMLIGRLEFYTALVLFLPSFWRR